MMKVVKALFLLNCSDCNPLMVILCLLSHNAQLGAS